MCKRNNLLSSRISHPADHRKWLPGQKLCINPIVSFFTVTCIFADRLHNIATETKTSEAYIRNCCSILSSWITVEVVRTDSDISLLSDKVNEFLASHHITQEHLALYLHHQNGAERYIQTILKGNSTLLRAQPWLRDYMWVYALNAYTAAYNNTPNKKTRSKTPNLFVTKQHINLNQTFLFSFGAFAVSSLPQEQREWKFDVHNTLCLYFGQPSGVVDSHFLQSQSVRMWQLFTNNSIHSPIIH